MSLIDEALRQARLEAARRELSEKGLPYPGAPTHMPASRRREPRRFVLPSILVLALLAVGVVAFLAGRRAEPRLAGGDETAATQPPTEITSTAEVATAEPRTNPPDAVPVASLETPSPASEPIAPAPARAARARDSEAQKPMDVEQDPRAVRVLQTGDGARLKLEGIVWSETRPLAVLNGRIAGAGEVVDGFSVLAVRQESVEVRYNGETFEIVLR